MQKNFNLTNNNIELIHKVMKENGIKTETKAVNYILEQYAANEMKKDCQDELVEQISTITIEKFKNTYYKFFERLRWATSTAEMNSLEIKDILNTILIKEKIQDAVLCDYFQSPVIETSSEYHKKKIAHFKQAKDDRMNKLDINK